jgi:hypothetical protein
MSFLPNRRNAGIALHHLSVAKTLILRSPAECAGRRFFSMPAEIQKFCALRWRLTTNRHPRLNRQ